MPDGCNSIMWKTPDGRYMSGEGQDQNVQITCYSTYGKQLLHILFDNRKFSADHLLFDIRQTSVAQPVFDLPAVCCAVPVECSEEGSHTLVIMKRIPGEPLRKAWPKAQLGRKLSTYGKDCIARQTAEYLLQHRNL